MSPDRLRPENGDEMFDDDDPSDDRDPWDSMTPEERAAHHYESQLLTYEAFTKEMASLERPDLLHHYTDGAGLLGILENGIRASHSPYLNDSMEGREALSLLLKAIETELGSSPSGTRKLHKELLIQGANQAPLSFFVACFSGAPNDLTQWRAYGGSRMSFQLTYNTEYLREFPRSVLVPCIYDPEEKWRIARSFVRNIAFDEKGNDRKVGDLTYGVVPYEMRSGAAALSTMFKHHKFSHEKEWRLVITEELAQMQGLQFRTSNSMIVPFVSCALGTEPHVLHGVTVGPTPHPEQNRQAVIARLGGKEHSERVSISDIPFRAW